MTSSNNEVRNSNSFVSKVLGAMTPAYFEINNASSKSWSPSKALKELNFTRIFDMVPGQLEKPALTAEEILDFYQNVYAYGYEYAFSQVINPLIEAIVDIDNQKLQTSFIEKHMGYKEEELLALMKKYKIERLTNDVKVDEVEFQKQYPKLPTDSDAYKTALQEKKKAEAPNLFVEKYGDDENFNKQMRFELAHGFTDACKVLFSSYIMELDFSETIPYKNFFYTSQAPYDSIQNKERTGLLKLYKAQKYQIGPDMSADIDELVNKWPNYKDSFNNEIILAMIDKAGPFFIKEENQIFTTAIIKFNRLQNTIVEALDLQIKALKKALNLIDNSNEELLTKITAFNEQKMSLSDKYNLVDELKAAISKRKSLAEETETEVQSFLEQANERHKFISESNGLIEKYKRDQSFQAEPLIIKDAWHYAEAVDNNSKMRRNTLISSAISIIAVAAVITLTVTTFGAGAALIPFIPAMIGAGVAAASAIGAFAASIYFGFKYQKTSQIVTQLDEKLSEKYQPSSEDRYSVSSTASTVVVHEYESPIDANRWDSTDSELSSNKSSTESIFHSLKGSFNSNDSTRDENEVVPSRPGSTDSEDITSEEEEENRYKPMGPLK